ncbi:S-layer homology domain-containing protein [Thermoanaerobacter italicus]|uniref:S-layer homology domain-containing protein n=1 Tax=Thermoanaerobacter italicus TaxID=108150 RepID=UPI001FDF5C9D|nr:S-layer homology domain-containing protein [Thermoanaerobacter italicus]
MVLTFALVFSAMAVGFAATTPFTDVKDDAPYASAVARLYALNITNGNTDGTYGVDQPVTRAMMVVFVNRLSGYRNLAEAAKNDAPAFSDVSKNYWAVGDINLAAKLGLTHGVGNGKFNPEGKVTYAQALGFMLNALGYKDLSWPYGVLAKAQDLGLAVVSDIGLNDVINRGQLALIMDKALDQEVVKYYDENGNPVLGDKLISKITDTTDYLIVATPDVDSSVADGKVLVQEVASTSTTGVRSFKTATTIDAGDIDFNQYLGKVVTIYTAKNGDEPLAVDVVTTDYTFTANNDNNVANAVYDEDGNYIELSSKTPIVYNGVKTTLGADGVVIYDGANVTLTDTDNDGTYDYAVVTNAFKYGPLTVESDVSASDAYIKTNGVSLQVSGGSIDKVVVTGSVSKLSDIETGDVVYYAVSADGSKVTLFVIRDSITGEVTKVAQASDGTYTVTIDGEDYEVSGNYTPQVGDEGTFALDKDGKIAGFIGVTATENYAIVLGIDDDSSANPQIKLFTSEGKTVIYPYDTSGDIPAVGDLISYSLDSDNTVTDITVYGNKNDSPNDWGYDSDTYVLADAYYLDSSTVVFNVYDDDYTVVDVSDITVDSLNVVAMAKDDYGNVEALVIDEASLSESEEASVLYGIVTDYSTVKTSDGTYYKITVLANNAEQTFTTTTDVAKPVKSTETSVTVYRISLNSDNKVRELTPLTDTDTVSGTVTDYSSKGIKIDNQAYALNSDVTVVKYDTVNDEYYVVGLNSLTPDQSRVTAYKDDNNRIAFIVVE